MVSSVHDSNNRLILCEGTVKDGKRSCYLILYERPSSVEDTEGILNRHGIGKVECELKDIYEFYDAVNTDSRTLFICSSPKMLHAPKIINCSSILNFELIEPSVIFVKLPNRELKLTVGNSSEASRWVESYLRPYVAETKYISEKGVAVVDSLDEIKPEIKRQCLRLINRLLRNWWRWKVNKPRKIRLNFPFRRKQKRNFVYSRQLPMLIHWNQRLIMLTERNEIWSMDFSSESEPAWYRSWPRMPPTILSCLAISQDTMYTLGVNGKIYSISLLSEEKDPAEWKVININHILSNQIRVIHGEGEFLYGITESGTVWRFSVANSKGSTLAQEFPNQTFSGFVNQQSPEEVLVYDSDCEVYSLNFGSRKSRKVMRGNIAMGQLSQLALGSSTMFNIQESDEGITQIHLKTMSTFNWNTLDLSADRLLTHVTFVETQQGCRLVGVDSFNTIYSRDIEDLNECKPWEENWLLPMPEKASYWNSDVGWEKIPVPQAGGFRDLSVSGDGSVWGLAQDQSVWSLGVEGGGWWKPISGQFTCISVGMKNNVWAVDAEGDVYCQLRDNVWIKDGESHGFRCVNVGSDGVIWGLDKDGFLWRRAENGWKKLQGEETWDNSAEGQEKNRSWGNNIWATTVYNQVYQYTFQFGWKLIPHIKLKSISVGSDGTIWGIDPYMDIYRYTGNKKFVLENGKLRSVHTGNSNHVWGLGCDGSVWRRSLNVPEVCYDKDFSKNALLCANLSSIAYDPREKIEERLGNMGLKVREYLAGGVGVESSFGFFASNCNSIVLVFRGTMSWQDVFADADMLTTDFYAERSYSSLRVHRGFLRYYTALKDQIFEKVDGLIKELGGPERMEAIYVTGHSLGGAMAILCSVDLTNHLVKQYGPQSSNFLKCLTYGAPPVGDAGFRQYWITLQTVMRGYHFQDPSDGVCHGELSVVHSMPINLFTLGFNHELLPPSISTTYLRLMQITIVTGKNSIAPWYSFDGAGTWGRVNLQLGDFRAESYYAQIYPLETLLRKSFGKGNTDSFFIDVAGVFELSQIRHFAIRFEKVGIFKDSWVLDGLEFRLDGKIIYIASNLAVVLDDQVSMFEGELDVNNPRM
ncbi:hypothetical protein K493DRAFT_314232 [Basidiobolus meristosporus CBS 931.73]|uniref:Fungal lipase-type domain-containing protein n=1 Tax=Basidiobolus meristosporus CBS 931.73 TaxID=1314790 RepID=A0A1Y1YGD3_9FUNG|nr:hypothetical protein K493DRAFT_314232 [Basidiobolus meristosporus CBS 931.73]|eukprot:ORX97082.1 hypothetical protein K493DRAFT_314232 [Basidiobolus meristosporus CBS 931.73]